MASKRPKITIIKPFSKSVQMDPNYAEKTWALLRDSIKQIHEKNASGLSFEELYRNAYNMVLHKYGDTLYKGLRDTIHEHLRRVAAAVAAAGDDTFLDALEAAYADHCTSQLMIRDILMYLDRVYVKHNNVANVYDLGLAAFRDCVARHTGIRERLLALLLGMVARERRGEVVARGTIKAMTSMLVDLGVSSRRVYEDDFERHFLDASATHFRVESQRFIAANACADYLRKAERLLRDEAERVAHYLDPSTAPKLRAVCERELLAAHMAALAHMPASGLVYMLEMDHAADLRRMYELFGRVAGGHELVKTMMATHLRETGLALVHDDEKQRAQATYVQPLLDLRDKYDALLRTAFGSDKHFLAAVNEAFERVVNDNAKSPEFISLFIDEKLKKGLKGMSEAEVEVCLDKTLTLFRFVQEKDVFERYFQQHLGRRLLLGRSVSDDAERQMIGKLKRECGYQFTAKLEGMFKDMGLSAEMMDEFAAHVAQLRAAAAAAAGGGGKAASDPVMGGVDLSVNVLTTGFWPTQAAVTCELPAAVARAADCFRRFYLSNHNGRRLTYQTNMGTAELRAHFGAKRHELSVSTYQMVLLLLYNERSSYTFKELREASGVPPNDLRRNLLALTMGRYKVLLKSPPTKQFADEHTFTHNAKFRSKLFRVRIMAVAAAKETTAEAAKTRGKVDEDRKHLVEAAIVRVMKSRKTLNHNELIAEVTRQLAARFMPPPALIKKRIESLIEREYLERDAKDRRLYQYCA